MSDKISSGLEAWELEANTVGMTARICVAVALTVKVRQATYSSSVQEPSCLAHEELNNRWDLIVRPKVMKSDSW